ncbi:DUF6232 family protein [Symbioplanes lichenis]|uniref:DUF6232 family protein n=1 Tax=Symbioplanes lichenis TaxID=1629072 RepID=UPI0027390240|nr:DUF6232 family protein [Actinoplanes lichenis]
MRTYYRGPDAIVTGRHFVWLAAPTQVFHFDAVREVRVVRGEPAAQAIGALLAGTAGLVTLAGVAYAYAGRSVGLAATAAAALFWLLVLTTVRRRAARTWSLEADYAGTWTIVYSSADITAFNQVKRAVRRNLEDRVADRDGYGLAAA